jgi:hypothetical protein
VTQWVILLAEPRQLQQAKVVGGRLYILLLIADPEGEEPLKLFATEEPTE